MGIGFYMWTGLWLFLTFLYRIRVFRVDKKYWTLQLV